MRTIKNPYEQADVRIILLDNSDIITTSGNEWDSGTGGKVDDSWDFN